MHSKGVVESFYSMVRKILFQGYFDFSARNNKMRNISVAVYSVLIIKLKQKLRQMILRNSHTKKYDLIT